MPEMTPHIGLKKPLATETADISVINDNMDMIDLALGDLSTVPTTAKDAAGAIAELHSEIEAIDVNIPDATLTTKGKVQLSSATNSTAEDRAATPKAVKTAVDAAATAQTTANAAQTKANAALPASSYTADDVLAKIKTVDGVGSSLDADFVRGRTMGSARFPDNWKTAAALPSSYAELGETIFFVNSVGGWPSTYGTVVTLKSYPAAPCTQYFYPYISDAPPKYRNAIFGADVWTEWRTIWDTSQLRVNAGQLEFYDGTGWMSLGSRTMVASNTVRHQAQVERVFQYPANSNKRMLVYKFIPPGTGEFIVSAEMRNHSSGLNSQLKVLTTAENRPLGTSSPSKTDVFPFYTLWTGAVDYRTPDGTVFDVTTLGEFSIGSVFGANYLTVTNRLIVHNVIPIYFLVTSGSTLETTIYIRNLSISYDLI